MHPDLRDPWDAFYQSTAESRVLETVEPRTLFMILIGIFVVGATVGSFINVVAYRLPIMAAGPAVDGLHLNLAWPPSHCPHCGRPVRPRHNIPLLSYWWLKGRSACCQRRISLRYPLGETVAGLLSVAVIFILTRSPFAPDDVAAIAWSLILVWWLLAITCLLWQQPGTTGKLTQSLIWLGLLANLQDQFTPLNQSVLAVCCCYSIGWLSLLWSGHRHRSANIQTMCGLHLLAAGCAWFGFALVAGFTGILAILCVTALAVFEAKRQGPWEARLNFWSTWLQGFLASLMAYQWFLWTQGI